MPSDRIELSQRRRAQIVTAAEGLFATRGFDATSMADIVKASGLATGTVYHYFDGKEAVVFAVSERVDGGSLDDGELPVTAIEDAVDQLLGAIGVEHRGQISAQVWGKAMGPGRLLSMIEMRHERLRSWLTRMIVCDDGESSDAQARAELVICALAGAQLYIAAGVAIDRDALRATLLALVR